MHIHRLAAEHLCPVFENADCTKSATARSKSAAGETTSAFLPEVCNFARNVDRGVNGHELGH